MFRGNLIQVLTVQAYQATDGNWLDFCNRSSVQSKQAIRGWAGVGKVSCILGHWGAQLILAYSWVRPAILVAGKGRGGMFLFLLFLHFHSCSLSSLSLSFISSSISSFFSLSLKNDTK